MKNSQLEGSLISSPSGVPMRVNFFEGSNRSSELTKLAHRNVKPTVPTSVGSGSHPGLVCRQFTLYKAKNLLPFIWDICQFVNGRFEIKNSSKELSD